MDQVLVVRDDLIRLIDGRREEFRQGEPLRCHLVAVVGVDELVVVDAVWGVAFDALHGGLAGVEGEDVVDERLAVGGKFDGFGRVGLVVAGRVGLADFEVFAWVVGGEGREVGGMVDWGGIRVCHFDGVYGGRGEVGGCFAGECAMSKTRI